MKLNKYLPILTMVAITLLFSTDALAADEYKSGLGLGAGIAMGLSVLGAGIGQGLTGRAALEGISRNPQASGKIQTPMLIALAFIESLVIYALVISYFLQDKI